MDRRTIPKPLAPHLEALHFPGTAGRVVLPPDPALKQALAACLGGWTPKVTTPRRQPDHVLAAVAPAKTRGLYHLQSRYTGEVWHDLPLASTVCALIADLSQDFAASARGSIGLHGGAVEIGGQLILITGPARAGKSTLVTRLAAAPGVTFFCDDVLPVTARHEGVALGIAPRLRLPVPAVSPQLSELAASAMILSDDRYGYLRLPSQAAHGSRAPVGAILLLDRQEGAVARLHQLDPAEALSTLLQQSITDYASASDAFTRARALTAQRPCLRLVYSDPDAATALIVETFGPHFATGTPLPDPAPPLPRAAVTTKTTRPPAPASKPFRQAAGTRLRRHGNAAWLWQPGEAMLWQLNPVAHAVWVMLEVASSAQDLATALSDHFAEIPLARLQSDIAQLLAELEAAALITAG